MQLNLVWNLARWTRFRDSCAMNATHNQGLPAAGVWHDRVAMAQREINKIGGEG